MNSSNHSFDMAYFNDIATLFGKHVDSYEHYPKETEIWSLNDKPLTEDEFMVNFHKLKSKDYITLAGKNLRTLY
jgi:hypothetical protein